MTHQPTAPPVDARRMRIFFFIISIGLTISFLYRAFVPAHGYPGRTGTIMDMVIDAGMLVGLIATRKAGPHALFWIAVIAGVGLFAIRLHGDASWWTGHWHYSLSR